MNIHWKDWYWCWSSNTLATWCKELTHWKRPWCWERLQTGDEAGDRGWDGWMASLTQWTWVWANLWEIVKDGEAWSAAIHWVARSQTLLSNWTTLGKRKLAFRAGLCPLIPRKDKTNTGGTELEGTNGNRVGRVGAEDRQTDLPESITS